MTILLLLAGFAFGQSTGTVSLQTQMEISNLGKAVKALENGRPVIPGQPRYINGICFDSAGADCQTTAATPAGLLVFLASTAYTTDGTSTVDNVAVATLTVTNSSTRAFLIVGANMQHSGTNGFVLIDVLVNGARVGPAGFDITAGNVGGTIFPMNGPVHRTVAVGTNSYGLVLGETGAGTASYSCNGVSYQCYMEVWEISE